MREVGCFELKGQEWMPGSKEAIFPQRLSNFLFGFSLQSELSAGICLSTNLLLAQVSRSNELDLQPLHAVQVLLR